MFASSSINGMKTSRRDLYAFRISGTVTSEDMAGMAKFMNEAFDKHDSVDMLLYFDNFEGREPGAGFGIEQFKSQFRALSHVNRYVTANAPEQAQEMISFFDNFISVKAENHDTLQAALAALNATKVEA